MARTGDSVFCFLMNGQFDCYQTNEVMRRLNTDDNKCGVPLNRFAHNQMFGNHQSILTGRARTSSFAIHRHGPSKV